MRVAGLERYYVKGQWSVRGDSRASEFLRMPEFQSYRLSLESLPLTGEGLESAGRGLWHYTPRGPETSGVEYSYGC